jgi:hypothetical protein
MSASSLFQYLFSGVYKFKKPFFFSIFITLFFYLLVVLTSNMVPRSTVIEVISTAEISGLLDQTNIQNSSDMYTECGILEMSLLKDEYIVNDLFSANFLSGVAHPCDDIRMLLKSDDLKGNSQYARYYFGTRHLFTIAANFFSLEKIRLIMGYFSVLSCLLLILSTFLSGRKALYLLPFFLIILINFISNKLSSNIGYAPGLFIPLTMLSFVIFFENFFSDFNRRMVFYGLIFGLTIILDILNGPIPLILSLVILTNYFCFKQSSNSKLAFKESFDIAFFFFVLIIFLYSLRVILSELFIISNESFFRVFVSQLFWRLGRVGSGGDLITYSYLYDTLFSFLKDFFFGSKHLTNLFKNLSLVLWLFIFISVFTLRKKISRLMDLLILLFVSLIIVFWFLIFFSHSAIHAWFMCRILIIPLTCSYVGTWILICDFLGFYNKKLS